MSPPHVAVYLLNALLNASRCPESCTSMTTPSTSSSSAIDGEAVSLLARTDKLATRWHRPVRDEAAWGQRGWPTGWQALTRRSVPRAVHACDGADDDASIACVCVAVVVGLHAGMWAQCQRDLVMSPKLGLDVGVTGPQCVSPKALPEPHRRRSTLCNPTSVSCSLQQGTAQPQQG